MYSGDSNDTIQPALADLQKADADWAPRSRLSTPMGRTTPGPPSKPWLATRGRARDEGRALDAFPDPLFARLLPITGEVRPIDNEAITAMFGDPRWHAIWKAKLDDEIEPAERETNT